MTLVVTKEDIITTAEKEKVANALRDHFERLDKLIGKLENPIPDDLKNVVINIDKDTEKEFIDWANNSNKKGFFKADVKLSDTFGFETALKYLKEGKKLSRTDFNNASKVSPIEYISLKDSSIMCKVMCLPFTTYNEEDYTSFYTFLEADILADDWYLVE